MPLKSGVFLSSGVFWLLVFNSYSAKASAISPGS